MARSASSTVTYNLKMKHVFCYFKSAMIIPISLVMCCLKERL